MSSLIIGIPSFHMTPLFQRLGQLFRKEKKKSSGQSFSFDAQFNLTLTEIAQRQHRERTEVLDSILRAGVNELLRNEQHLAAWESLSWREQEVTALICIGYSSQEIASILGISYDTVRTHSKHIYYKFNLKRKELCQALRDWHFAEWWESTHGK